LGNACLKVKICEDLSYLKALGDVLYPTFKAPKFFLFFFEAYFGDPQWPQESLLHHQPRKETLGGGSYLLDLKNTLPFLFIFSVSLHFIKFL
jgi:hypothetical protein